MVLPEMITASMSVGLFMFQSQLYDSQIADVVSTET